MNYVVYNRLGTWVTIKLAVTLRRGPCQREMRNHHDLDTDQIIHIHHAHMMPGLSSITEISEIQRY